MELQTIEDTALCRYKIKTARDMKEYNEDVAIESDRMIKVLENNYQ